MALDIDKLLGDSTTIPEEPEKATVPATVDEKKPPKKKGKPRGGNSPMIGNNGLNLESGDNAKYLAINVKLFEMPDIDLTDVAAVKQRLIDYFNLYIVNDMKPTVAGMALALNGRDRHWLWAVANDAPLGGRGNKSNLPPETTLTIKKAYKLLENLWESYMNSGKINPVSGIFLGKNNYGYKDKAEYVLTPKQDDNDYNIDDIKKRYADALPIIEEDGSSGEPTS